MGFECLQGWRLDNSGKPVPAFNHARTKKLRSLGCFTGTLSEPSRLMGDVKTATPVQQGGDTSRNEPGSSVPFPRCKQLHRAVMLASAVGLPRLRPWSCGFSEAWESGARSAGLRRRPLCCRAEAGSWLGMALEESGSATPARRDASSQSFCPGDCTETAPGSFRSLPS